MSSRLWFVHNPSLEQKILAFLARYQELYRVTLYAFVLMGNHFHLIARFPEANKAAFMRSFNAIIAKLVASEVKQFPGGKLWGRRYSDQVLPRTQDIEHWFLYAALNPVTSGICSKAADYDGYNSFTSASQERVTKYKHFERWKYNEAKRSGVDVDPAQFEREHTLKFSRIPGYEDLSSTEYRKILEAKMEFRRKEVLIAQQIASTSARTRLTRRKIPVGSTPLRTKISTRDSHRPLVLTLCTKTRKRFLNFYFDLVSRYQTASLEFRTGAADARFPYGTYRPTILNKAPPVSNA